MNPQVTETPTMFDLDVGTFLGIARKAYSIKTTKTHRRAGKNLHLRWRRIGRDATYKRTNPEWARSMRRGSVGSTARTLILMQMFTDLVDRHGGIDTIMMRIQGHVTRPDMSTYAIERTEPWGYR